MLCLTRNEDERIRITTPSGPIWIQVLRVGRNHRFVKLGIDAPDDCHIEREEIIGAERKPRVA